MHEAILWLKATIATIVGAALGAGLEYLLANPDTPMDWAHFKQPVITGAVAALLGYLKQSPRKQTTKTTVTVEQPEGAEKIPIAVPTVTITPAPVTDTIPVEQLPSTGESQTEGVKSDEDITNS